MRDQPNDLRSEMVAAGLLIGTGIDGVLGRGAVFEDVLTRFNAVITRWGVENGAEAVHFPPVMNWAQLERNGYLKSFPQLAVSLSGFRCEGIGHHALPYPADLPTGLMMVPAACYPLYPLVAARGALPAEGALFDIHGWCFRREPLQDELEIPASYEPAAPCSQNGKSQRRVTRVHRRSSTLRRLCIQSSAMRSRPAFPQGHSDRPHRRW